MRPMYKQWGMAPPNIYEPFIRIKKIYIYIYTLVL